MFKKDDEVYLKNGLKAFYVQGLADGTHVVRIDIDDEDTFETIIVDEVYDNFPTERMTKELASWKEELDNIKEEVERKREELETLEKEKRDLENYFNKHWPELRRLKEILSKEIEYFVWTSPNHPPEIRTWKEVMFRAPPYRKPTEKDMCMLGLFGTRNRRLQWAVRGPEEISWYTVIPCKTMEEAERARAEWAANILNYVVEKDFKVIDPMYRDKMLDALLKIVDESGVELAEKTRKFFEDRERENRKRKIEFCKQRLEKLREETEKCQMELETLENEG